MPVVYSKKAAFRRCYPDGQLSTKLAPQLTNFTYVGSQKRYFRGKNSRFLSFLCEHCTEFSADYTHGFLDKPVNSDDNAPRVPLCLKRLKKSLEENFHGINFEVFQILQVRRY